MKFLIFRISSEEKHIDAREFNFSSCCLKKNIFGIFIFFKGYLRDFQYPLLSLSFLFFAPVVENFYKTKSL